MNSMSPKKRAYFDRQVECVLNELPRRVLRLLDEIPLHVEDYPSRKLIDELELSEHDDLCGCFTGVAIDDVHNIRATTPNMIYLFRRGIFSLAYKECGVIDRLELRKQIRITILHELAHFHGMSEEEITAIGYG